MTTHNLKRADLHCYFCDKQLKHNINNYAEKENNKVLVQAAHEKPEEAKVRHVCSNCDPKR